jgi:3-isopropylmalate/(R)-2-methylmalate dehydratase small subunit
MVALPNRDVDTDQITPARFLKGTDKTGLGGILFADWRYEADGSPKRDFPLSRPGAQGAKVLVAGDNFGCGSSREHAPWALLDFGFEAVISTSFADIFSNNSLKNGLLPIHCDLLVMASAYQEVEIDLPSQTLRLPDGRIVGFPIDGFTKRRLIEGVDQLGYLLSRADALVSYEESHEVLISTT